MNKPYSLSNFFDELTNEKPIETRLENLEKMHLGFENNKTPYSRFGFYPRFRNFEDVALSVISPITSFFTLATYTAFAALISAVSAAMSLFFLSMAGIFALVHEDEVLEGCLQGAGECASICATGLASTCYLICATIVSPLADALSLFIRTAETITSEIEECIQIDNSYTCSTVFN